MRTAEARHTQRQGHRPNAVETSAAPAATGAAQQPLPCEPIEPALSHTAAGGVHSIQGSMGGGLASHASELVAEPERRTALSIGPQVRITPELRRAAVEAVKGGVRRSAALILAGIPPATAGRWLAIANGSLTRWPDGSPVTAEAQTFLRALSADFARAEAERERQVVQNIVQAAQSVNEKTGIPEWRAGAWLLEHGPAWKRDYAEFREQRIEHAGTVDHQLRMVQQMGDAELLEAAPAEWRELVVDDSSAD